jgi:hypothetical protein
MPPHKKYCDKCELLYSEYTYNCKRCNNTLRLIELDIDELIKVYNRNKLLNLAIAR